MDAILPVDVLSEGLSEPDHELRQGYQKAVDWPNISFVRDVWSGEFRERTCESLHPSISRFEIGWTPDFDCHDLWWADRLGDLLVLLRYPEQLQGTSREFNAQLETASLRKMKDWRTLLLQYLLQQNRSVTGEDKVATDAEECRQYFGMPLLTDLAVMVRIDPLDLIHGQREFVTVVYGPVMSFVFPDV